MNKLVQKLFVDRCSVQYSLTASVVSDEDLLRNTPVAYVVRERNNVLTKAIGYHATPHNAFGIPWRYCDKLRCAKPRDIRSVNHGKGQVKQNCLRCGWVSKPLSATDLGWLKLWSSSHPKVYTWAHPLTPLHLLSFVHPRDSKGKGSSDSAENMDVDS